MHNVRASIANMCEIKVNIHFLRSIFRVEQQRTDARQQHIASHLHPSFSIHSASVRESHSDRVLAH